MSVLLAEAPTKLLTAEEFGEMDFGDRRVELVEGEVVDLSRPRIRHRKARRQVHESISGVLVAGSARTHSPGTDRPALACPPP